MGVHCRLEKAIGPTTVGLGAVHRQIGILDQLIEIGAILRRQSNADAGVGHELVAEALIGLTDRLMNARHEFHDVAGIFDIGLDHRELIAAKPGDMVGISDAIPDAPRHGFQQLIADMMSERVVDALELVDIDVKQRELLAAAGSLQFLFDSFAEQHSVRQVCEGVVMRQMRNLLVGATAIGNIVDDVDDISGLPGVIRNPDAP